jgi:hypothetical protein
VLEAGLMRRTDEVLSGAAKKEKVDGSTPR